jgi:hypothetical protein
MPPDRLPFAREDPVLRATRAYAAVRECVPPYGLDQVLAFAGFCRGFCRALRTRMVVEVAQGLPADVVRDLMLVAIRFAVTEAAYGPVATDVEDAARELLDSTARALRPIDPDENE